MRFLKVKKLIVVKDGQVNFNSFEVLSILGSGAFGRVFKVVKKGTNKVYAMKALKKHNLIVKNQLRYAVTEANVLKQASHPFVLQLHYAFQVKSLEELILKLLDTTTFIFSVGFMSRR